MEELFGDGWLLLVILK